MMRIGKMFSIYEEYDKGVYQMLKLILKIINVGKKVQIFCNGYLMKELLVLLYVKMKQKM